MKYKNKLKSNIKMARCLLNMQAIERELANYNFHELKKSASIGAGKSLTVKYAALRVQHAIEKQAFLGALLKGLNAARGAMGAAPGVMSALRGGAPGVMSALRGGAKAVGGAFPGAMNGAGGVMGALRGGAGAVGGALRSAAGAAPGIMRNAAGAAGDAMGALPGAVRSGAGAAGDALRTYGRNLSGSAVRNARQTSEMFPFSPSRPMPELASQLGKLEMARDSSRALTGAGLIGGGLTAGAAGAAMNKESGLVGDVLRTYGGNLSGSTVRNARRVLQQAIWGGPNSSGMTMPELAIHIRKLENARNVTRAVTGAGLTGGGLAAGAAMNKESGLVDFPVRQAAKQVARRAARLPPARAAAEALMDAKMPKPALLDDISSPPHRMPADAMPYNPAIHGADDALEHLNVDVDDVPMIMNEVAPRRIPDMLSKAMKYLGIGGLGGAGAYGGYKALNSGGGADMVPDALPADLGKAAAIMAVYPELSEKQAFLSALLRGGKLALQGGKYVAKGMGQLASTGFAAAAPHIRAGAQAAGAAGADMMKARPGLAAAGLVGAGAAGAAATIPAYNAAKGAVNSGINAVNNNVISPIQDTMTRIHNSGVGMREGYNKGLPQKPKYYSGPRQGPEQASANQYNDTYRAPDSDMYRQNY